LRSSLNDNLTQRFHILAPLTPKTSYIKIFGRNLFLFSLKGIFTDIGKSSMTLSEITYLSAGPKMGNISRINDGIPFVGKFVHIDEFIYKRMEVRRLSTLELKEPKTRNTSSPKPLFHGV
jgi:hypothetical protein